MEDGYDVALEPLLSFSSLGSPIPNLKFDAIALTSATALEFCDIEMFSEIPVFTTGKVTAEKASAYGFANVQSAEGGAMELTDLIKDVYQGRSAKILYPSALQTAHDLSRLLKPHNIECINWPVYQAVERKNFSSETLKLLGADKIDLVLLYSHRTAKCFSRLWERQSIATQAPSLLAISQNVKAALPKKLAETCFVADKPNETSMRLGIKDIFLRD
jgi:uroporphyrinogen-III synthase